MSQPFHLAAQPEPPKPPIVRLPTWVNVVLVLILLASCGANNNNGSDPDESQIATQVVNELQTQHGWGTPSGPASSAEVEDMCRLLGAVAAKQGVPLSVLNADEPTRCHEVAQEASNGVTP